MSKIDNYDYELPKNLIAQYPSKNRGQSRLLVVDRKTGTITDTVIGELPNILNPQDSIVLNDTKVIPARLRGTRKTTGGKWEGLFIEVQGADHWKILSKTRGKIQPGEYVELRDRWNSTQFRLRFIEKLDGGFWIVCPNVQGNFVDLLEKAGQVPLPPYIRGGVMTPEDLENYQTVYASRPGAVAAPTAGLHFTNDLLGKMKTRNIGIEKVTLHVGIGTFRPIAVEDLADHSMHSEWGQLTNSTAESLTQTKHAGGRICSIGTTTVRVLETCASLGSLSAWEGMTDLFIKPGFEFKAIDVLLTNFHLPKSSLLVLVSAFGGDKLIQEAYRKAIEWKYRFYSYGDAMLII